MKQLPSTDELNRLFSLNLDTGVLTWNTREDADTSWNKRWSGRVAGYTCGHGYTVVQINKENYQAHKLVWKMVNGNDPVSHLDHKDRNRTNNRPDNLREASRQENNRNKMSAKGSSSRFLGVYLSGEKWAAQIVIDGKVKYLGRFICEKEAALTYNSSAERLFGEFANFNKVYSETY